MFSAWNVGINLRTFSNFSLVAANISRQAAMTERSVGGLRTKISGVGASATEASSRISGMGSAANIAGRAFIGLGVVAAAGLAHGIRGAANLQSATLQAAVGVGRLGSSLDDTMSKMKDFREYAMSMSTMTGQSVADSMGVLARMATAGLSAKQIGSEYRQIAQFTDVLHFGKDKMAYEHAAALGAGLTHDMRLFNPEDSKYGLARIAQMGYLSPHGTDQLTTQVRRMAPALENILPGTIKQKADEIVKLAAWADRMGNLPFAGSAITQMITQMVKPRSERVAKSLEELGVFTPGHREGRKYVPGKNLFWDDKAGTFDLMGAMNRINQTMETARGKDAAGPAVMALFGGTQNMIRIMGALTSKEALGAKAAVDAQMAAMGKDPTKWLDNMQTQLMGTLAGQTGLLTWKRRPDFEPVAAPNN